jgi:crotonobetainyl-CoA:carnitine CoA-transferase CaiB-like acyl-CoA transferase
VGVMDGIRILEVAEHTFVPAATAILADWGADVIKIEHAERGDAMRGLGDTGVATLGGPVHALLEHSNRGKRSFGLDLSDPAGVEILYRLAARCDVFVTNKMPGVRQRLAIDVEDIRAHNPEIIYVRGSGYGNRGPDADAGGYDFLAFWCRAGCADAGTPVDLATPVRQPGPGFGDSIGAMTIAGGVAAALLDRERTGTTHIIDVSLLGSGMWALGGPIALSDLSGQAWENPPVDATGMPSNPLTGVYRTADGRFIALAMLQGFFYWPDFCSRIGRGELVGDPRFDSASNLMANADKAASLIAATIGERTLVEWQRRFEGMKGQWSVVQNTVDVVNDPQVVANGYLQEAETADGTRFRLVSPPVQFDNEPTPTRRAPNFNEHGDDLLQGELGLEWEAIMELKIKGVIA